MQALGFIETKGLIAAVEGADAMLKAAEVTLYDKTYVGGGLVSIAVMGGVAAVKAAVEAGVAAVNQINSSLLVSSHVIPRPHEELDHIIVPVKSKETKTPAVPTIPEIAVSDIESADMVSGEKEDIPDIVSTDRVPTETTVRSDAQADIEETEAVTTETAKINTSVENTLNLKEDKINKVTIDHIVSEYGWEKALEILDSLKVTKLRNLAREYKNLKIAGRKISKADKKVLLTEFKDYYGKN